MLVMEVSVCIMCSIMYIRMLDMHNPHATCTYVCRTCMPVDWHICTYMLTVICSHMYADWHMHVDLRDMLTGTCTYVEGHVDRNMYVC